MVSTCSDLPRNWYFVEDVSGRVRGGSHAAMISFPDGSSKLVGGPTGGNEVGASADEYGPAVSAHRFTGRLVSSWFPFWDSQLPSLLSIDTRSLGLGIGRGDGDDGGSEGAILAKADVALKKIVARLLVRQQVVELEFLCGAEIRIGPVQKICQTLTDQIRTLRAGKTVFVSGMSDLLFVPVEQDACGRGFAEKHSMRHAVVDLETRAAEKKGNKGKQHGKKQHTVDEHFDGTVLFKIVKKHGIHDVPMMLPASFAHPHRERAHFEERMRGEILRYFRDVVGEEREGWEEWRAARLRKRSDRRFERKGAWIDRRGYEIIFPFVLAWSSTNHCNSVMIFVHISLRPPGYVRTGTRTDPKNRLICSLLNSNTTTSTDLLTHVKLSPCSFSQGRLVVHWCLRRSVLDSEKIDSFDR